MYYIRFSSALKGAPCSPTHFSKILIPHLPSPKTRPSRGLQSLVSHGRLRGLCIVGRPLSDTFDHSREDHRLMPDRFHLPTLLCSGNRCPRLSSAGCASSHAPGNGLCFLQVSNIRGLVRDTNLPPVPARAALTSVFSAELGTLAWP